MITNVKEVQREMKRILMMEKMKGITKHVEDVQAVFRKEIYEREFKQKEMAIYQSQSVAKATVADVTFREIEKETTTIQCFGF